MAKNHWPGVNPVGQRFRLGAVNSEAASVIELAADQPITIVGVVDDVVQGRTIDLPIRSEFYLPLEQQQSAAHYLALLVRTNANPSVTVPLVRAEIAKMDPQLAMYDAITGDELIRRALGPHRLAVVLLSGFAGVALLLATVGLYAIIAFSIAQRVQEIGIRLALGAQRYHVLRLIVGQGMRFVGIGVLFGLIGVFACSRLLQSLLFGIGATDLGTIFLTTMTLAIVAFCACYIPARRATRVDPMEALRYK
jgi:putative ABC transport system permease protein